MQRRIAQERVPTIRVNLRKRTNASGSSSFVVEKPDVSRVNPGTGCRLIAVYHCEQLLTSVFYPCFSESVREVVHKLK
jgi:hypothetical protein